MVVLSAAILNKAGKILLARQFVEMTRMRIEGILQAFPKLIEEPGDNQSRQHTYVETGSIRYVYQPIDSCFIVLITTRGSNIVQDLDTLNLLSKIVPEYSMDTSEDEISRNIFELTFAFDEVITLGYKENTTLDNIRKNLEMDSNTEKLFALVEETKIYETKQQATSAAQKIQKQKLALNTSSSMPGMGGGYGGMSGMGGTPGIDSSNSYDYKNDSNNMDNSVSSNINSDSRYGGPSATKEAKPSGIKLGGKGMSLGNKGKKGMTALEQMAKEEKINLQAIVQNQSSTAKTAAPGAVVRNDPIEVSIGETVTCIYDKDSALNKIEVKGIVTFTANEDDTKVNLSLEYYGDVSPFQFTTHPQLSKPEFQSNNILQLKNTGKAFPKGKPLQLLKWRYSAKEDESLVPVKVLCWPESNGDGTCTVNLEVELLIPEISLQNLVVCVPLPSNDEPEISSIDGGSHTFNSRMHRLQWDLGIIDQSNSNFTMEFVAPGQETDFFPCTVSFTSDDTICPIHISSVQNLESGEATHFGLYRHLNSDRYEIIEANE